MTDLELALLLLPPTAYLFLVTLLNAGTRVHVLGGQPDRVLLGLALVFPLLVGPVKMLPLGQTFALWETLFQFPGRCIVWGMLLFLLVAAVFWLAARCRKKIVLYNLDNNKLATLLTELAPKLDNQYRWAGNSLFLPSLNLQFAVEVIPMFRNITLIATSPHQDPESWKRLEAALRLALREVRVRRNPGALLTFLLGLALGGILVAVLLQRHVFDTAAIAGSLPLL